MNKKKIFQGSGKMNQFQRTKKTTNLVANKKLGKGIQCRECEGFGHIQSECANTLKKKGKSLKTTWSDNESDDSEEDDNNISNYVVFHATTQKINDTVTLVVPTDQATATTSEVAASSDNSDSSENEDSESDIDDTEGLNAEEILKAYEELLQKFIKVHTLNKSLKDKICDLVGEKKSLEESVTK